MFVRQNIKSTCMWHGRSVVIMKLDLTMAFDKIFHSAIMPHMNGHIPRDLLLALTACVSRGVRQVRFGNVQVFRFSPVSKLKHFVRNWARQGCGFKFADLDDT